MVILLAFLAVLPAQVSAVTKRMLTMNIRKVIISRQSGIMKNCLNKGQAWSCIIISVMLISVQII